MGWVGKRYRSIRSISGFRSLDGWLSENGSYCRLTPGCLPNTSRPVESSEVGKEVSPRDCFCAPEPKPSSENIPCLCLLRWWWFDCRCARVAGRSACSTHLGQHSKCSSSGGSSASSFTVPRCRAYRSPPIAGVPWVHRLVRLCNAPPARTERSQFSSEMSLGSWNRAPVPRPDRAPEVLSGNGLVLTPICVSAPLLP